MKAKKLVPHMNTKRDSTDNPGCKPPNELGPIGGRRVGKYSAYENVQHTRKYNSMEPPIFLY